MLLTFLLSILPVFTKYEILLDRYMIQKTEYMEYNFEIPSNNYYELQVYLTVAINNPVLYFDSDRGRITDTISLIFNQTTQLMSFSNQVFPLEFEHLFSKYYYREKQITIGVQNLQRRTEYNLKVVVLTEEEDSCLSQCNGFGSCKQPLNICYCIDGYLKADCSIEEQKLTTKKKNEITLSASQSQLYQFDFMEGYTELLITTELPINYIVQCEHDKEFLIGFNDSSELPMLIGNNKLLVSIDEQLKQTCQKASNQLQLEIIINVQPYLIIGLFNPNNLTITAIIQAENLTSEETDFNLLYIILIVFIMILIIVAGLLFLRYKSKQQQSQPMIQIRKPDVNKENCRPKLLYQRLTQHYPGYNEIVECLVCLQEFKPTDSVKITVCYHLFHLDCLVEWSKVQNVDKFKLIINKELSLMQALIRPKIC